jgi:hypothetical protein
MMSNPTVVPPYQDDPVTAGERRRVGALLASISSKTLLQSLVGLCGMNEDAKLIISELVDRLPPDRPD